MRARTSIQINEPTKTGTLCGLFLQWNLTTLIAYIKYNLCVLLRTAHTTSNKPDTPTTTTLTVLCTNKMKIVCGVRVCRVQKKYHKYNSISVLEGEYKIGQRIIS